MFSSVLLPQVEATPVRDIPVEHRRCFADNWHSLAVNRDKVLVLFEPQGFFAGYQPYQPHQADFSK